MNHRTVLITGASSGIGFELSRIFSQNGFTVIMTARDGKKLLRAVRLIRDESTSKIISIAADLSKQGSAEKLFGFLQRKKISIDILVNNAGFGSAGPFLETDIRKDLAMIQLNITALTVLTKLAALSMQKRGSGKILNVASVGSYMSGPYIAEYYATKAYVLSFTEALSHELKGTGVVVSALCPGATKTEFAKRAGKNDAKNSMSAEEAARDAYKGLMNNRRVIIPGIFNKTGILIVKILPRSIVSIIVGRHQIKQYSK